MVNKRCYMVAIWLTNVDIWLTNVAMVNKRRYMVYKRMVNKRLLTI